MFERVSLIFNRIEEVFLLGESEKEAPVNESR
jgi:hypothetical protein